MIDPSLPRDPQAPKRLFSHELILWGGFGLCLVIGVLTVVLPELSGADGADKKPMSAPPGAAKGATVP